MKRCILCLVMCLAILFTFSLSTMAFNYGLCDESTHDPNRDGVTDSQDYLLVKRVVLGTISLDYIRENTYYSIIAMDINDDRAIDSLDYAIYKRMVLGTYNVG